MSQSNSSSRTPVYFLSVGGPNFIEDKEHPAYIRLGRVGREITGKVKPKAVIVFSAHWQGGPSTIKINIAEHTDLIYDFSGFPSHYYEIEYPHRGSPELAENVVKKLSDASIQVEKVERGFDHGVWVGFLAAFDPKTNPLDVPIVQVSLYGNEDASLHYRLGEALEDLRDEGVLIIGAGMAVHNLHDFRRFRGSGKTMPYAETFGEILKETATVAPEERRAKMVALMERDEAREAHPSFEHLLPLHVCAGAAGPDRGEELWAFPEASLNWAQYRSTLLRWETPIPADISDNTVIETLHNHGKIIKLNPFVEKFEQGPQSKAMAEEWESFNPDPSRQGTTYLCRERVPNWGLVDFRCTFQDTPKGYALIMHAPMGTAMQDTCWLETAADGARTLKETNLVRGNVIFFSFIKRSIDKAHHDRHNKLLAIMKADEKK